MKKQTKAQKFADYAAVVKAIKEGQPVKRRGAKDGSIATHSTIPVPDLSEKEVLLQCLRWLRQRKIMCNRNNTGAGELGISGYYNYGIKDGGDIIGILKPLGKHFELEIKRGKGGRLSAGQQKRMQDVKENGGIYLVIHGIAELEDHFGDDDL